MTAPVERPAPFDAFGLAAMDAWCGLPKAARELRHIDAEMKGTMTDADTAASVTTTPDAAAKLRSLASLMRSLHLGPDSIRRRQPAVMRELEAACRDRTQRHRCARGLWAGTAAGARPDCCPHAARLGPLRHA